MTYSRVARPHRPKLSRLLWAMLLYAAYASSGDALAAQTLVQSGELADGAATFSHFSAPVINQQGTVLFTAELNQGVGGATVESDSGVWRITGNVLETIAREGSGDVPGVDGAVYDSFPMVALDNHGGVVVRGKLRDGVGGIGSSDRDGLWRFGTTGALLERTEATSAAGTFMDTFKTLNLSPVVSPGGKISIASQLKLSPTANSANDRGIWMYTDDQASLVAREGVTGPQGVASGAFSVFKVLGVNNPGESVVFAELLGAPVGDQEGLWRLSPSGGSLIAQRGVTLAPGTSGEVYDSLVEAATINAAGSVAFGASLFHSGSVDATNDRGVWLAGETDFTLLARSGEGSVAGIPGADYSSFSNPQLNSADMVLVRGELALESGVVTESDSIGLWRLDPTTGEGQLLARTGSGGTAGVSDANFSDFLAWDLNDSGQIAFAADLELGVGGVTSADNRGLWLVGPNGDSQLVARTGDQLGGQTIASLSFAGGETPGASGLNDAGQIAFLAEFTSGASGIFLHGPSQEFLADFDDSNSVDGGDLALWQTGFGLGNDLVADANGDSRVDGSDFLIWQRETTAASLGQATAVPAPSSVALLAIAYCCGLSSGGGIRIRRNSR